MPWIRGKAAAPQPSVVDGGAPMSQTKITTQRTTCKAAGGGLSPPVSMGVFIISLTVSPSINTHSCLEISATRTATKAGMETAVRPAVPACKSTVNGA